MSLLFAGLSRAVRCGLLGVMLGLLPPVAWLPARAHAVITEDSLAREPVHPDHPTQVRLQFNTGVEIELSRVTLVSKGDIEQTVATKAGAKPSQVMVSLPPRVEGNHALRYQVFAADSHLTQEIHRFRVGTATGFQ